MAKKDGDRPGRPDGLDTEMTHGDGASSVLSLELDLDGEHARPRKRTRRACDKCSTSRTRCDGECPCRRCEEYGYACRYNRQVKKRGRLPASISSAASQPAKHSAPLGSSSGSFPRRSYERKAQSQSDYSQESSPPLISPSSTSDPSATSQSFPAAPQRPPAAAPPETAHHSQSMYIDSRLNNHSRMHPIHRPRRTSAPLSVESLVHQHQQFQPPQRPIQLFPIAEPGFDRQFPDNEALASDESVDYASPVNSGVVSTHDGLGRRQRHSMSSAANFSLAPRDSFSTVGTASKEAYNPDYLQKAPTEECCHRFLDPVIPYIRNIIPASVACDLLDIFLTDPGSSLFRGASPYILTRIFRKKSILHPTAPRPTTPALLATILWCVAQTADVMLLHVPGSRARIVNELYDLATSLVSERDPDKWRRIHGGLSAENEIPHPRLPVMPILPNTTAANEPAGVIDDVLTFILLSIAVSGGDFKSDCYKWWSKATRLASSLGLNREDERCPASVSPCANPLCSCHKDQEPLTPQSIESREERRRVFWLLYSLDRHLALSFNTILTIPDSYCEVFAPYPETVWENLDTIPLTGLPTRTIGPPTIATGTGFFEYFLPLMAILGDIIEIHHRRRHSRLGDLDDTQSVAAVSKLLSEFELSLETLTTESALRGYSMTPISLSLDGDPVSSGSGTAGGPAPCFTADESRARLVKAYSTHILHVLHVLLHGKWDAISMLDDGDDWITSKQFNECASHAISASQSVSTILTIDPELTFMSYLFGIYLLQGSFILLLFADRMPQLGLNESVEQACENIIRAHEVCVVTLSTEFQKNFRKVVRSTLYSVRGAGTTDCEEHRARRRALSLYRWTKGAKGLAL